MLCKLFDRLGEMIYSDLLLFSSYSFVKGIFQGQECFRGQGCGRCQQQCLDDRDQPCTHKWGSNYALNPNMVYPKFHHNTPFVLPTKVTLKLAALHCILHFHHWQRILPILPPLSNEHIILRHKTQHLINMHDKTCKHYLHRYFYGFSFHPPLSTPSSQAYASWDCLDTSLLLVYLGEWTAKYNFAGPIFKKKCLWHGVNFVKSALQYIILLRETYKFKKQKYYRWHGVNKYMPYLMYLFLRK